MSVMQNDVVMVMEMEIFHSIPARVQCFTHCRGFQLPWESICFFRPMGRVRVVVMVNCDGYSDGYEDGDGVEVPIHDSISITLYSQPNRCWIGSLV